MLELIDGLPGNIVGIAVSGRMTMQDCQDVLVPAIKKSRKRHDKIRLYYELNSRFPGAAWDDLDLGLEHASCCERVAIVTDIGWVKLTVKAIRFLIPVRSGYLPPFKRKKAGPGSGPVPDLGRMWVFLSQPQCVCPDRGERRDYPRRGRRYGAHGILSR